MASTYLQRTPTSAGNSKTFTFSAWVKKALASGTTKAFFGSGSAPTDSWDIFFNGSNAGIMIEFYDTVNGFNLLTTSSFRDPSAWYHIVVAVDTTQATASDRYKMYVNGVQQTAFNISSYPTQNFDLSVNQTNDVVRLGLGLQYNSQYFDGCMSHVHWIDGTAYDASAFGEYDANGVWKPITSPSVTYGTNGFFLKMENSGSMGTDSSGNGNNFTVNGTLTQTIDSPSNVYATLNPLAIGSSTSGVTYSNGNTTFASSNTGGTYPYCFSTLAMNTGKWYAEFKNTGVGGTFGISDGTGTASYFGAGSSHWGYYSLGDLFLGGTQTGNLGTVATNDIVMVAVDLDNNYIYWGRNGTWLNSGDPTSGATGTGGYSLTAPSSLSTGVYHFTLGDTNGAGTPTINSNFGNGYFGTTAVSSAGSNGNGSIFEYDVPSGFYALNTKNLATYG